MSTLNQLRRNKRTNKIRRSKTPALNKCPQKKAVCTLVTTRTPRKPNSAKRKVVKVHIRSVNKKVYVYIPGEKGHDLQKFSTILMRGGRVKDLPGMKYHLVRGKFDFPGLKNRITSRSKYGTKKSFIDD